VSRLATGGRIDRARPLRFTFDGLPHVGYAGDTLASALLANGIRVLSQSVTYARIRGIVSAGVEEPNGLVQVGDGAGSAPMLRATQVELYDGLVAESLNGRGRLAAEADPARYDKVFTHCDVLVVGAGPAGLAAGLAAGRTGARVLLVDEQAEPGGTLLGSGDTIDGRPGTEWIAQTLAELVALPDVRVLSRATAFGYYDQNCVLLSERRTEHLGSAAPSTSARQRLWQVRAKRVVLATGAHERPIAFADNDRPGIMLAGSVRTYVNRYAVVPGHRAVVFTNNDSAYACAVDLDDAGLDVPAVVDVRPKPAGPWTQRVRERGIEVLAGHTVLATSGGNHGLDAVSVGRHLECDLLCVSGGFNPAIHLFTQSQGRVRYDEARACFVPDQAMQAVQVAGAANGTFGLTGCIWEGLTAGAEAASVAGFGDGRPPAAPKVEAVDEEAIEPYWLVPGDSGSTQFVDLERDVTVVDMQRAVGAGMRSVEHVKRYTTIGTGSDQGKTGGISSAAIVAALLGQPVAAIGTTTFRPPYVPVSFGLMAGRTKGQLFDPVRVTTIHPWHQAHGAVFEDVGHWKRPWYFPQADESMDDAILRECRAAREGVAVMDASTLGKIDIQGPDALTFLNRLYTNAYDTLAIGHCRYGMMCKADGMVFDDGVVMHLAPDRYLATTTTGGAAAVMDWTEEWLQTEWTDMRVRLTSVTDHWATIAVVGPRSREVMRALAPAIAVDAASFPFMAIREGLVAGVRARVCRISFSGELAFEIHAPSWYGLPLWEAVMVAGESLNITPYGTGALHVLRAEKGYPIIGQETDGTVTPQDLGMSWIVSKRKDFIGRRSHRRPDITRPDRRQLVGLLPSDPQELLPEGAQLTLESRKDPPVAMVGHVTSSYRSAALGRTFALALVKGGRDRMGDTIYAPLPDGIVAATVTEPIFYDKEGLRRDG
jgi:sarcosine oxidase subunit alpha